MKQKLNLTEIAILLPPHYQKASTYGLLDLFQIANLHAVKLAQGSVEVRITQWELSISRNSSIDCTLDTHPHLTRPDPAYIIIPPSLNEIISPEEAEFYRDWIVLNHSKGVVICSVCSGAFLLGETTLLNGRSATTHWFFHDQFKNRFPEVEVDIDKLIIDDGDIITVGGLMAWVDLGLYLIDRLFGPTIMVQTAQFMLVDPTGREQRHYSHFAPTFNHGDENILKAQHWLQQNTKKELNISILAKKAGLSERTFLRRFQRATGINPTAYCQRLRVAKSRELLEHTKKNVEEISWAVGYEDPGAFRKVFSKIVGLTPGEYRMKFQVR